ncbi:MAG: carbohydrate ABC transporter permease [Candidatus Omnitrophica bacterium]|nr:carbohydrate ABC transporter permease [Candidatus Omnitrophota bacterium]
MRVTAPHVFRMVLLILGSAICLTPFFWMLLVSLDPSGSTLVDVNPWDLKQWDVGHFEWENFSRAMTIRPFDLYAWNSVKVTLLGILGEVISSSIVGYGFARLRFKGRNFFFILVLATMMLPPQVTMVPLFLVFRTLGWIDTLKPLIVPAFFGNPFAIFLFRQYFMTLPSSLDEAALIDGASRFQIYWRILMPLCKPVIATVAIFAFLQRWNDFLTPMIYLSSEKNYTLALGLASFQGQYSTDWNLMMAASLVVMAPCLLLFFIGQKFFVTGIAMSGNRE